MLTPFRSNDMQAQTLGTTHPQSSSSCYFQAGKSHPDFHFQISFSIHRKETPKGRGGRVRSMCQTFEMEEDTREPPFLSEYSERRRNWTGNLLLANSEYSLVGSLLSFPLSIGGFHSSPWLEPLSVHWLPMTSDPSRPCTFAPRLPHRLQDLERFPFSKPFAPCSSPSLSA